MINDIYHHAVMMSILKSDKISENWMQDKNKKIIEKWLTNEMQKILNADEKNFYTILEIKKNLIIYWCTFFDQKIQLLKLILDNKMNKIENAAKI